MSEDQKRAELIGHHRKSFRT